MNWEGLTTVLERVCLIYLIMLLLILYFNRDRAGEAFRALTWSLSLPNVRVQGKLEGVSLPRWQMPVAVLSLAAITFGFNQLLSIYLGFGKG